ncbi:MAG: methylmalonyl Co-A mutase-associated GTPase MeaB [Acidimicrobiales bacterium]
MPGDSTGPTGPAGGVGALFSAAVGGDRAALARLITLIERGGGPGRAAAEHAFAAAAAAAAVPRSGAAAGQPGTCYTVGLTGAPGVGKSTLVNRMLKIARQAYDRVAVIAIDPSSPRSGGALLGDRVRMVDHTLDPGVFIRSMAARGHLGGLSSATSEVLRLMAAVGYELVLLETVGVGQTEVEIAAAADTTIVAVSPGWGDSVQVDKAGLLEVADVFVVNKADRPGAARTVRDIERMLDLSGQTQSGQTQSGRGRDADGGWRPPVVQTTAAPDAEIAGEAGSEGGIRSLLEQIGAHRAYLESTGLLGAKRTQRLLEEVAAIMRGRLVEVGDEVLASDTAKAVLAQVEDRELAPHRAAELLIGTVGDWTAGASPPAALRS